MNNSSVIQLVISLACFYMQSRLLVCCAGYFEATLQSAAETFFLGWIFPERRPLSVEVWSLSGFHFISISLFSSQTITLKKLSVSSWTRSINNQSERIIVFMQALIAVNGFNTWSGLGFILRIKILMFTSETTFIYLFFLTYKIFLITSF